jgi:hypothetical protein
MKHVEKYLPRHNAAIWLREMADKIQEGAEYVWIQMDIRHASKVEIEEQQKRNESRGQTANQ